MLWLLLIRQIKWICGFDPRNHRLLLRHSSFLTAAPSKCILSWFWCAFPTNLSINLSVQCAAAVKVPNIRLHRSGPCNPIRFSLLDNEINQLLFFRFIVHTVPSRQVPLLRWWMTAVQWRRRCTGTRKDIICVECNGGLITISPWLLWQWQLSGGGAIDWREIVFRVSK